MGTHKRSLVCLQWNGHKLSTAMASRQCKYARDRTLLLLWPVLLFQTFVIMQQVPSVVWAFIQHYVEYLSRCPVIENRSVTNKSQQDYSPQHVGLQKLAENARKLWRLRNTKSQPISWNAIKVHSTRTDSLTTSNEAMSLSTAPRTAWLYECGEWALIAPPWRLQSILCYPYSSGLTTWQGTHFYTIWRVGILPMIRFSIQSYATDPY